MPPAHTAVGILAAAVARLEQQPLPASLTGPVDLMLNAVAPEMDVMPRFLLANRDILDACPAAQVFAVSDAERTHSQHDSSHCISEWPA